MNPRFWSKYNFVRLVIPYGLGIVLAYHLDIPLSLPTALVVVFTLLLISLFLVLHRSYRRRHWFGVSLALLVLALGFIARKNFDEDLSRRHFGNISDPQLFSGWITDQPEVRARSVKFFIKVDRVRTDKSGYATKGNMLIYAAVDSASTALNYGDRITFKVVPQPVPPPRNPYEFDYRKYLRNNRVYHQLYLGSGQYVKGEENEGFVLKRFSVSLRRKMLAALRNHRMPQKELAVAYTLLAGDDSLLDPDQRQSYAGAGVVHILSISGLHVGIIYAMTLLLLGFLPRKKPWTAVRMGIILAVIWFFALLTGLAPSVLRASLMFSLFAIGSVIDRKGNVYNTLAASAFILMVINPGIIHSIGFQLSYLAVLGIVIFQPHFQRWFKPKTRIGKYVWSIVTVSLAAQLVTGPLALHYFNQFPNYFLLANIIALTLIATIMYTGIAFVAVSFVPFISQVVTWVYSFEIKLLNVSMEWIEQLPFAVTGRVNLSLIATLAVYLFIVAAYFWLVHRNRRFALLAVAALLIGVTDRSYSAMKPEPDEVMIYAVNNRSAIHFISGRQSVLLVDSATLAEPSVLDYNIQGHLVRLGIEPEYKPLSALSPGFFTYRGKRYGIVNRSFSFPYNRSQLPLDYLILRDNPNFRLATLQRRFPGAVIIADGSNQAFRTKRWQREADSLAVVFHSTRESGYYCIDAGGK